MNRIKKLRKELGKTQTDIAKVINLTDRTIGYYENGERDPDTKTLGILSNYFKVSIDYLLGVTDVRNPKISSIPDEAIDVSDLSEESKKELEKFKEFLKLKEKSENGI